MELDIEQSGAKVSEFIELSRDGYAIYGTDDTLTYCNPAYADLYFMKREEMISLSHEEMTRRSFHSNRGVKIDSGDIDEFLRYVDKVRRSRPFRLFEVDFIDNRWFLFSEQMNDQNEMLVQIKEITKQKVLERDLETSVLKLSQLALTDELTRCANRRGFVQSVEAELTRCRRTGASMTMLLMDLDFFKKVNDDYGHQTGDAALKHIADLVKKDLRQYDIFGRIGGEEFAVFLSNTTQQDALEISERIRERIASEVLMSEGERVPLSVSIGLTTEGCNTSFEALYTEADSALYKAKEQGRNRVVAYTE